MLAHVAARVCVSVVSARVRRRRAVMTLAEGRTRPPCHSPLAMPETAAAAFAAIAPTAYLPSSQE